MAKKKPNQSRPASRAKPSLIEDFQLEDLLRLMADHDLSEIDIHDGERGVALRRATGPAPAPAARPW